MTYDKPYYTGVEVERCAPPEPSSLHRGLDWDEINIGHCKRLTPDQIAAGLGGGYIVYEEDPIDCRFRILFQLVPHEQKASRDLIPVWRLIISTENRRLRPVSVMEETRASAKKYFLEMHADGEIE